MAKRDRAVFAQQVPLWKARHIIEGLGGVPALQEKLIARGFFPPGIDTVQGWASRNSIPGAWSPAVFGLAIEANLIKNPLDALIKDAAL